ncbi:hypothetical protein SSP35_12_01720 [Streptomyces sp. NBRC 110611]|nr:hypothetical protein SSP35_12_01720 [Streptomyces sp. NBRC 110611]
MTSRINSGSRTSLLTCSHTGGWELMADRARPGTGGALMRHIDTMAIVKVT